MVLIKKEYILTALRGEIKHFKASALVSKQGGQLQKEIFVHSKEVSPSSDIQSPGSVENDYQIRHLCPALNASIV